MKLLNGKYSFEDKKKNIIGGGASSKVYKGKQLKGTKRPVAVKKIPMDDLKYLDSFMDEIDTLKDISGSVCHPNIICYYDYEVVGTNLYVITEYIEGLSLRKIKDKGYKVKNPVGILKELLAALEFVHSKNIVHADIKPENIIISGDNVKLIDFGLSCATTTNYEGVPKCKNARGTPVYMDPSRDDKSNCKSSDIFSLGITMYYLLLPKKNRKDTRFYGIPDFLSIGKEEQVEEYKRASRVLDKLQIPGKLKNILKKMINPFGKRPSATSILKCLNEDDCVVDTIQNNCASSGWEWCSIL